MFDHVTLRVPDLATARTALAVVLNELDIQETRSTLSFWSGGTSLSRRPTTTIPSHGASISRSSPPPQPMSTASAEPAPVPLRLDVTNTDQVAEAARQAQDVDLLINNAGRVAPGELTGGSGRCRPALGRRQIPATPRAAKSAREAWVRECSAAFEAL